MIVLRHMVYTGLSTYTFEPFVKKFLNTFSHTKKPHTYIDVFYLIHTLLGRNMDCKKNRF